MAPDVHDLVLDLEPVLEAAQLRDAHVERRLAALEPGRDRAAGARLLALRAAAGGLALAGGDAAADAGARLVRALGGLEVVELHAFSPASRTSASSSTVTRNRTWRTMPRVAGLSVTTLVLPMPCRPSARIVARLRAMWLIVLFDLGDASLAAIGHLRRGRRRLAGDPADAA